MQLNGDRCRNKNLFKSINLKLTVSGESDMKRQSMADGSDMERTTGGRSQHK